MKDMQKKTEKVEKSALPTQSRSVKRFLKQNWQLLLVLAYVLSPIDLIPEGVLPFAGVADDSVLVILELVRRFWMYSKGGPSDTD